MSAPSVDTRENFYDLSVRAKHQTAVLERILRVVRHRGYQLCSLNMAAPDSETISIDMRVCGFRPELLVRQLEKLVDVQDVRVLEKQQNVQRA